MDINQKNKTIFQQHLEEILLIFRKYSEVGSVFVEYKWAPVLYIEDIKPCSNCYYESPILQIRKDVEKLYNSHKKACYLKFYTALVLTQKQKETLDCVYKIDQESLNQNE